MKKLSVKRTKTKKNTLNDNKRNYFNCISNYNSTKCWRMVIMKNR